MPHHVRSILNSIAQEVFTARNVDAARVAVIDHIDQSRIKGSDQKKIVATVTSISSLVPLQRYIANALLKYEGMGVLN